MLALRIGVIVILILIRLSSMLVRMMIWVFLLGRVIVLLVIMCRVTIFLRVLIFLMVTVFLEMLSLVVLLIWLLMSLSILVMRVIGRCLLVIFGFRMMLIGVVVLAVILISMWVVMDVRILLLIRLRSRLVHARQVMLLLLIISGSVFALVFACVSGWVPSRAWKPITQLRILYGPSVLGVLGLMTVG